MLTHPSGISARFQTTFHFDSPGGVAASGIWTTQNCLCSRTCGAGRPYVGLCPIFLVIFIAHRYCLFCLCVKVRSPTCVMCASRRSQRPAHSTLIDVFILERNRTSVPRVASALRPAPTSTITAWRTRRYAHWWTFLKPVPHMSYQCCAVRIYAVIVSIILSGSFYFTLSSSFSRTQRMISNSLTVDDDLDFQYEAHCCVTVDLLSTFKRILKTELFEYSSVYILFVCTPRYKRQWCDRESCVSSNFSSDLVS